MANFTEPTGARLPVISRATKLCIVAAALVGCALVIGDNFRRYHGGPTAEELAAQARTNKEARIEDLMKQPGNVVWRKQTTANNIAAHDRSLADLRAAVGPQVAMRCKPAIRRAFRSAVENYVSARAFANKETATEPIARDLGLDKVWQTDDDAQALADARALMNQGYLVASEFTAWTDDEAAIMPLTIDAVSACALPIETVEPGDFP